MGAVPEGSVVERQRGDAFVVLACDGVWDVMRSADAVAFVAAFFERPVRMASNGGAAAVAPAEKKDAFALLVFGRKGADDVLDLREIESYFPELPVVHDKPEVVLGHDQIPDLSPLGEGVAHDGDQHVEQMQHDDDASKGIKEAELIIHAGVPRLKGVHAVGASEGELGDEPNPIEVLLGPFVATWR